MLTNHVILLLDPAQAESNRWFETVFRTSWEHRTGNRGGVGFSESQPQEGDHDGVKADPLIQAGFLDDDTMHFDTLMAPLATVDSRAGTGIRKRGCPPTLHACMRTGLCNKTPPLYVCVLQSSSIHCYTKLKHDGATQCTIAMMEHRTRVLDAYAGLRFVANVMPEGTRISKLKGRLKARSGKAKQHEGTDPSAPPPPPPVHAVKEWMAKVGTALIVRMERLPSPECKAEGGEYAGNDLAQRAAPLIELRHHVDDALGLPTTVHVYMNEKPGSQTLTLHADEADVLVVQVNGTKAWEVCAPAKLPGHLDATTSSADRAEVEGTHAKIAALNHLNLKSSWVSPKTQAGPPTDACAREDTPTLTRTGRRTIACSRRARRRYPCCWFPCSHALCIVYLVNRIMTSSL